MRRKLIPVEESFAKWRKNPDYLREYNSLEEEFALVAALIDARARALEVQRVRRQRTGD